MLLCWVVIFLHDAQLGDVVGNGHLGPVTVAE